MRRTLRWRKTQGLANDQPRILNASNANCVPLAGVSCSVIPRRAARCRRHRSRRSRCRSVGRRRSLRQIFGQSAGDATAPIRERYLIADTYEEITTHCTCLPPPDGEVRQCRHRAVQVVVLRRYAHEASIGVRRARLIMQRQ